MTDQLRKAAEMALEALEQLARIGNGEHYGNSDGNVIAQKAIPALRQALAQPKQEPVAWTQVSDALPKSGVPVLACYKNILGNLRRIRACWVAAKTEEASLDYGECYEYDEETDEYYLPEGWYECMDNWHEYSSVAVCEGEVTHWIPLPLAPDEECTAPPSKPWVSLTDEEIDYIWGVTPPDYENFFEFPRAIEAKLKEKNT